MRKHLLLVIFAVIIILGSVAPISAGWLDTLKEFATITGYDASRTTTLSIDVAGTNPAVVNNVTAIAATNPIESGNVSIVFDVTMNDPDGVADLDDNSVNVTFNKTGSTSRFNTSCKWQNDIDDYEANYTCTVDMYYWDANGQWGINVSGKDNGAQEYVSNDSEFFTYNELKAMVIVPTSLTWPSISPGGSNQQANNETVINNTGNYDGTITVLAIDLQGETDTSEAITAGDFTAGLASGTVCGSGTALVNDSATAVTSSDSNPGNLSLEDGSGEEEIYYCIPSVPSVSSQTYSTTHGGAWTLSY